jgi:predicted type IV restriction endonuclease
MSLETVSEIGAIVNVRSFRLVKNPGIASIFNRRLWGFSKRYYKRWNLLHKGVRVLFYGDKGIRMAARIEERSESSEPVEEWTSNPTGYPYHIILNLVNKEIGEINPITKDELVDVYDIPLAKLGFRGAALTIFGIKPKETPSITYSIDKFNSMWNEFLKKNNLYEGPIKPSNIEDRITTYVNEKSKLISNFPSMSEADTISTIIEPLLEILGWKILELNEVQRQYPVKGRKGTEYVDLALKSNGKPKVFVEVKSVVNTLDENAELQVINYAFNEGVDWCVLTNGREIRVYGAFLGRTTEQRLLFRLTIEEYTKNFDKLMLISKENIQQKLGDWAKTRYVTTMIKTWIQKNEERLVEDIAKETSLEKEKIQEAFKRFMADLK